MRWRSGFRSSRPEPPGILQQHLGVADDGGGGGGEFLAQVRPHRPEHALRLGGRPGRDREARAVRRHAGRALSSKRLDLLQEARKLHGLGVEVVATDGERLLAVLGHRVGGERDDGNGAGARIALDAPRRLPAVDHGQADVHQDQVWRLLVRPSRRPSARRSPSRPRSRCGRGAGTACPGSSRCLRPAGSLAFLEGPYAGAARPIRRRRRARSG